ncbi:hypothetical protein AB1Y20_009874 [Prymnesium parvum]|uniref:Uncharacterized protein n=1 Tax=Prymnesium parvum TaxID=97485 RepID=A0AB34K2S0_PRYPA
MSTSLQDAEAKITNVETAIKQVEGDIAKVVKKIEEVEEQIGDATTEKEEKEELLKEKERLCKKEEQLRDEKNKLCDEKKLLLDRLQESEKRQRVEPGLSSLQNTTASSLEELDWKPYFFGRDPPFQGSTTFDMCNGAFGQKVPAKRIFVRPCYALLNM